MSLLSPAASRSAAFVCATAALTLVVRAQSFTQTFGGPGAQDGVGAWSTETGYLVAARNFSNAADGYQTVLHATSSTGATIGSTTWPIEGNNFLQQVVSAPDGAAFVCGSVMVAGARKHDALFSKVLSNGTIQWTRTVPLAGSQQLFGGVALVDGGAVFCGVTESDGSHQPFAMRCDASGDTLWTRVEPSASDAEAYAVDTDGEQLVFTGRTLTFGGHDDILVFKTDLSGTPAWSSTFGGSSMDQGRAVSYAGDDVWMVAGWSDSFGPLDQTTQRRPLRAYLLALNTAGDTLWTRTHGDTLFDQRCYGMCRAGSGGIYLSGERSTPQGSDAVLMKLTMDGSSQWERVLDLGREDRLLHVAEVPNGVIGTGWSFGEFGRQVLFVRRNPDGN